MSENKVYTVIGMMSGTSLDGVDVALIRTDGETVLEPLDFRSFPYENPLREAVRACFGLRGRHQVVDEAERMITDAHIEAVQAFGHDADLIGFHGQTITHDPEHQFSWQIGEPQRLAQETGIDVIGDMRQADMRAGGHGAPLLPIYHRARSGELEKPLAVLNIGGVANVTYIGEGDEILAFDTGPGNALINDYVQACTGRQFDHDGEMAAHGKILENVLSHCLDHPYFHVKPPKSLDRNDFAKLPPELSPNMEIVSEADAVATLTEFTVQSVRRALDYLPDVPKAWWVTGGGRHNKTMMKRLEAVLQAPVQPVEGAGWKGDAIEAEGFAYLAVRSLRNLPLTLPSTTGVKEPITGGKLYKKDV